MNVRTSAGSTIAISAAQPAAYNQGGYSNLTWAVIGEVTNLGEFGRTYALVTHNPVGNRGTVKKKGSFNEGQMALNVGLDNADAGQLMAKAASASDDDYSFRVTLQDGSDYYFQAQVMDFKIGVGSVDQITSATITLELTTATGGIGIISDLDS